MADPYYDGIVGVDEAFLFPPEVMAAIAGSKELTAVADRLIQSYTKAISDNNRKQFGSGETDPTAPDDLIAGKLFYNTTEQATKQYNGKAWQVVGGPVEIPWADFADMHPNNIMAPDNVVKSLVLQTGKRIDFFGTSYRKPTLPNGLQHGEAIWTPKAKYRVGRPGNVACTAIQSGNGQSAKGVGAAIGSVGFFVVGVNTPDGDSPGKTCDFSGTYYTA